MRTVICLVAIAALVGLLGAQDTVFVCPMDPDVRSSQAGVCPRCGMKLASNIPDPVEYHMDLTTTPRALKPLEKARMEFFIHDPWKDRQVTKFQVVHEKLFHMFVVSQDLQFFLHNHPIYSPDGSFYYDIAFPKPGMYRVLGDFYPDGATPQLIAKTVLVPGTPPSAGHAHARLFHQAGRKLAGGANHRSAAAHRRDQDAALLPYQARRGIREISRRLGPYAGGERRFDRPDPHASFHRRWRSADSVQRDVSRVRGPIGCGFSFRARAW